ncbi:autotransporter domain-containing protein [Brucella pituitosa]|uniref:autotransporter domain-containing protein n=1 Tax=Brucella pituitosa TaxID=571256 RepID=UPI003C729B4B
MPHGESQDTNATLNTNIKFFYTPPSCSSSALTRSTALYATLFALCIASSPLAAENLTVDVSIAGGDGGDGNGGIGGVGGSVGHGTGSGGDGGSGNSEGQAGTGGGLGGTIGGIAGGIDGGGGAALSGRGGGGGGGSGIVLSGANTITNNSNIAGGNGGNGEFSSNNYANGGGGGDGITLKSATGTLLVNKAGASISGGGGGGGSSIYGSGGSGGDGISLEGDNSTIINAGTISGGGGAFQSISAGHAVSLTGDNNQLELWSTSIINGDVVATGSGNMLTLGGSTNGSFTASALGGQYQGFDKLEKSGSSSWTITGDASGFTGTTIVRSGALSLEGTLGGTFIVQNGALSIDGGNFGWAGASGQSFVGQNAGDDAELLLANGGQLTTVDKLHIADMTGSRGFVGVQGDGSSLSVNDLTIGFAGDGTLSVTDSGHVSTTAFMNVGSGNYGQLGTGSLLIDGAGSTVAIGTSLQIAALGDGANGSVTLSNGGLLSAAVVRMLARNETGSATINIGAAAGDAATGAGILDTPFIDLNTSGSLVFNHNSTNYSFTSVIAGKGAISHKAGVTTFAADSDDFRGTTNVSGGTLLVGKQAGDGSLGGTVNVLSGGTLGGAGSVGRTDVEAGGALLGQQGQRLTFRDGLTLNSDSTINVALGNPSTTSLFHVAGNLTLDGTLNITDQGGFGAGVYRLFDYVSFVNNGLEIGNIPSSVVAGDLLIQTAISGQINLINASGQILGFWDGSNAAVFDNNKVNGGSGIWRADGRNWTTENGAVNGPFQPNPTYAVFQGTAGTVDVDDTAGAINVTGMQFAVNGYRIEGDPIALQGTGGESIFRVGDGTVAGTGMTATIASDITGASSLVKSDYGTLVLSGNNSYTGGTKLRAGTVSIGSDTNLGAASTNLMFSGGTLATTAGFVTDRDVILSGAGTFDVAASTELGLNGAVTGAGDLIKSGGGTLRLSNATNSYGNAFVQSGTLIGDAGSISGNIGNAGTVVFNQLTDGSFAGDIAGLDGVSGSMIKQGAGSLTLTGASKLDWIIDSGNVTTAAGRFNRNADIASGASLTFDQTDGTAYEGVLTGAGRVIKTGSATVFYNGDSSFFEGSTEITNGAIIVGSDATQANAVLGGSFNVETDGVLGGHGTVGSGAGSLVTITSGGTIAPGNSIGTFKVNGNLTFDSGSIYQAEITPALESNLINASGTVTIHGGTVYAVKTAGLYTPGSRWAIIGADGGVSGAFDNLDQNMPFVDLALAYNANHVYIDVVRNTVAFCEIAETRNQCATGNGLESTGGSNSAYNAVAALPDETGARNALDQLSGEIHASVKTALIEDSHFVRDAAINRIRSAFDGDTPSIKAMPFDSRTATNSVQSNAGGLTVWGQGLGAWSDYDSNSNAATLKYSTGGFLFGADAPVFDTWRLGVVAGYSHTNIHVDERFSQGDSDNYHLGVYGGTSLNMGGGTLGLRTGLSYSWHEMDFSRSVSFPGFSDNLESSYSAETFQAFGDLGYRLDTDIADFEPFAALAYVTLRTDDFAENGATAALHASSQITDTTFTTLGIRASTEFAIGSMNATARAVLGWRHAFGDATPISSLAFSAGENFTIAGASIAEDAALIETGFDMVLTPSATLGLSYQGQLASSAKQHGFKANLALRF